MKNIRKIQEESSDDEIIPILPSIGKQEIGQESPTESIQKLEPEEATEEIQEQETKPQPYSRQEMLASWATLGLASTPYALILAAAIVTNIAYITTGRKTLEYISCGLYALFFATAGTWGYFLEKFAIYNKPLFSCNPRTAENLETADEIEMQPLN